MTWTAREKDHDDGFMVAFDTGTRFGGQELRQCQTAERETPDGHKITSTKAITKSALIISPDCQHGNIALPRPGILGHTIIWLQRKYSRWKSQKGLFCPTPTGNKLMKAGKQ